MPKLYKITKNIFVLTPASNIYSSGNVNFILDKKITLIDSGSGRDPGPHNIRKVLRSLGVSPPRIDKIIITHSHIDHFVGASRLKKYFNPEILAHSKAKNIFKIYCESRDLKNSEFWEFFEKTYPRIKKTIFLKYLINFIYKRAFGRCKGLKIHRMLQDGDEINLGKMQFRVIFTPGHSPDSICLYEPNKKILFSGDMIPWTPYIHTTISDFENSIKKLLELDVKLAIRGHGRPVLWSDEKPKYIQFLKDMDKAKYRILKILKLKGPQTAHQMANSVFQRTHVIHKTLYTSLGRVSVYWIVKYLEELEQEGKVTCQVLKNKFLYSLK
ncbi:MAG: MBL fold metallo-hydrolase [Candidatus Helarchaeota archaeon]